MEERWIVTIKYLDICIGFDFDDFEAAACFAHDALVHNKNYIRVEIERIVTDVIELKNKEDLSFEKMLGKI